MVAVKRILVILLIVSASLALAPAATALDGDTGMAVSESPPVRVSDLEKALTAPSPAADGPVADPVPEPAVVPSLTAQDTVGDVAMPLAESITLLAAVAPRAPTTAEALATLADSGLAPEHALALVPALTALVADADATVAALVPLPAAARAPAVVTGLAGAALMSLVLPPVPAGAARLYSRIRPGDALEHPVRREVFERIRAEPGVHANRIKEDVGIGNGTLVYHLDVLTRERLVTKVDAGRFTRYFAAGSMGPREMRGRATLLAGSGEKLFDLVTERPGVAVKELAASTGLSVPAVHRALDRLESAGLVEKRREGRGHALYPNPDSPLVAA